MTFDLGLQKCIVWIVNICFFFKENKACKERGRNGVPWALEHLSNKMVLAPYTQGGKE